MRHFALTIRAISGCVEGDMRLIHVCTFPRGQSFVKGTLTAGVHTHSFINVIIFDKGLFLSLCVNVPFSILHTVSEMRPMVLWSSYRHIVYFVELTVPWEEVVQDAFKRKRNTRCIT